MILVDLREETGQVDLDQLKSLIWTKVDSSGFELLNWIKAWVRVTELM